MCKGLTSLPTCCLERYMKQSKYSHGWCLGIWITWYGRQLCCSIFVWESVLGCAKFRLCTYFYCTVMHLSVIKDLWKMYLTCFLYLTGPRSWKQGWEAFCKNPTGIYPTARLGKISKHHTYCTIYYYQFILHLLSLCFFLNSGLNLILLHLFQANPGRMP